MVGEGKDGSVQGERRLIAKSQTIPRPDPESDYPPLVKYIG